MERNVATRPRFGSGRWVGAALAAILLVAACGGGESGSDDAEAPLFIGDESPVRFVDVAEEAGITIVQSIRREPPDCLFNDMVDGPPGCVSERMTGGAAAADFDGDGLVDLYVTALDGRDALYRNNGDGTFTDVTEEAGLASFVMRSNGAGWADLNNNGWPDLVVTTVADERHYLFMNNGDGTFREEALQRGVALRSDLPRGGYTVAFGDFDNDGWLDMHITEWLDPNAHPVEGVGRTHARLLRNLGPDQPGFFEDVTEAAGVSLGYTVVDSTGLSTAGILPNFSFSSAFVDLDNDGWPDLVIAADYGTSQLFWNNGDGTFTEGTAEANYGSEGNAMGLTVGDVNANGLMDVFVTAIYGRATFCQGRPCPEGTTGNRLYINQGDRTFVEGQDEAGVRDGAWGWGTMFFDADNSGSLDIIMTNGVDLNIDEEFTAYHGPYKTTPKRFWLNNGDGTFVEVSGAAGIDVDDPGLGLLTLDVEGNGFLDVLVVHNGRTPTLWRNEGVPGRSWLKVDVQGTDSNRDAIGAVVTVTTTHGDAPQVRHVGAGSHFIGQSEKTLHFGLGTGTEPVAEVRVFFPTTGREVVLTDVERNTNVVVVEPVA